MTAQLQILAVTGPRLPVPVAQGLCAERQPLCKGGSVGSPSTHPGLCQGLQTAGPYAVWA